MPRAPGLVRPRDPLLAKSAQGVPHRPWTGLTASAGLLKSAEIRTRWCQLWVSPTGRRFADPASSSRSCGAACKRCGVPDLGTTVCRCPLASTAGGSDCYSLGYSVARVRRSNVRTWVGGRGHQRRYCILHGRDICDRRALGDHAAGVAGAAASFRYAIRWRSAAIPR